MLVLAKMVPRPAFWISGMESTMSYETVPSTEGMQELTYMPSKGVERSSMTRNLPGTFLAWRPSGYITYAGKIGPMKGSIILYVFSSFSNFASTACVLTSSVLLFPFTDLTLPTLSFTNWWIGLSSLR